LRVPGIGALPHRRSARHRDAVAGPTSAARQPAPPPRTQGFDIQQRVPRRPTELGINLFVIILSDFFLLPLGVLDLDLALEALRTAATTALEVFVGIEVEGQQGR